ncbi:MAG: biopolymer transporter ExbD [Cyanobacteria bacterium P01_H01_bin.119]
MKLDIDTGSSDLRIEILPLIDVIFCILIFFVLAAVGLTRQQAINLDLPAASTGAPLPEQGLQSIERQKLFVSLDDRGQVYIDQQPVSLNLLYDILIQHQQTSPNGLIVLNAAREARYADVIQVLDLLRSVGGDRVALATLPAGLDQLQQLDEDAAPPDLDELNQQLDDLLDGTSPDAGDSSLPGVGVPIDPDPALPNGSDNSSNLENKPTPEPEEPEAQ